MKLETFRGGRRRFVLALAYFCMAMMIGAMDALLDFLA